MFLKKKKKVLNGKYVDFEKTIKSRCINGDWVYTEQFVKVSSSEEFLEVFNNAITHGYFGYIFRIEYQDTVLYFFPYNGMAIRLQLKKYVDMKEKDKVIYVSDDKDICCSFCYNEIPTELISSAKRSRIGKLTKAILKCPKCKAELELRFYTEETREKSHKE